MTPPHILFVNPWIHDFAAFDFWAKPLGLLQLAAITRQGGAQVTFMDCLDRFHPKALMEKRAKISSDGRGPFRKRAIPVPESKISDLLNNDPVMRTKKTFSRYGIEPEWFKEDLKNTAKPDLILVTSLMTYWASGVKETISVIKEVFSDVPVVLGGIYATLCTEHACRNSMADQVVAGRGDEQIYDIVKSYTGFSLADRDKQQSNASVVKNPIENKVIVMEKNAVQDRSEVFFNPTDLDALPFPALDLVSNLAYAPVLTSRGCPFSCTYCASSFLEPQFRHRSPESVFQEICHWHENYGASNIAFYDDALLINPEKYILPLLEKLLQYSVSGRAFSVDSLPPLSFHTPNALHIRQITRDVAEMMFRTGFKTIRLGLETTDFSTARKEDIKVKENEFYHAVKMLKQAGFHQDQIGAYLLCGLPGQNLNDVEHSIMVVKNAGIIPVLAYYTPIPHTPMWKKALIHSRFDLEEEPFFTNNALLPCLGNEHEIKRISELKKMTK
ncbi:MAG: B12-binding domain-containing radical SAM protein [Desulfamplus sp.]|nr:B12-binding domain-containing radical SAM protein [Desulfamplus sp.]